jgi:hypothetical protein
MAKQGRDSLKVVESDDEYRLKWWISEDEDYGATVGERGELPTEDSDIEWYTAEVVCFRLYKANQDSDTFGLDYQGFWWSSKVRATKVLTQIHAETQVALSTGKGAENPWPDWAITAKAAGWKPPKGWKP